MLKFNAQDLVVSIVILLFLLSVSTIIFLVIYNGISVVKVKEISQEDTDITLYDGLQGNVIKLYKSKNDTLSEYEELKKDGTELTDMPHTNVIRYALSMNKKEIKIVAYDPVSQTKRMEISIKLPESKLECDMQMKKLLSKKLKLNYTTRLYILAKMQFSRKGTYDFDDLLHSCMKNGRAAKGRDSSVLLQSEYHRLMTGVLDIFWPNYKQDLENVGLQFFDEVKNGFNRGISLHYFHRPDNVSSMDGEQAKDMIFFKLEFPVCKDSRFVKEGVRKIEMLPCHSYLEYDCQVRMAAGIKVSGIGGDERDGTVKDHTDDTIACNLLQKSTALCEKVKGSLDLGKK